MLILTRKVGESLLLNDEIEIKVTEIQGDRVRIGIEAPRNYRIIRKELRQTVESNREAAESSVSARKLLSLLSAAEHREEKQDQTGSSESSSSSSSSPS